MYAGGGGGAAVGVGGRGGADPIWVVLRSAIRDERKCGLELEFDETV